MKLPDRSRLLFIGDSITDCGRARPLGEGRPETLGTGYVALIDSLLTARFPAMHFRVTNMGIGGNTVRDLAARWQTDVLDLQPDVLTVMVGINDVWRRFGRPLFTEQQVPPTDYAAVLNDLLARTRPTLKRLVLMTPFFIEANRADPLRVLIDEYVTVMRKAATAHDGVFVDTQAAFDRVLAHRHSLNLSADRIHPNPAGHALLAETWLTAMTA